jgi:hypothetical protein
MIRSKFLPVRNSFLPARKIIPDSDLSAGKNKAGVHWGSFFCMLRAHVRLHINIYACASLFLFLSKKYPELTNTDVLINSNSDRYFTLEPTIISQHSKGVP